MNIDFITEEFIENDYCVLDEFEEEFGPTVIGKSELPGLEEFLEFDFIEISNGRTTIL